MGCDHHPGRKADTSTSIGNYCAQCAEQIKKAQARVDLHVTPKDCFIIYKDASTGWAVPYGTGCAHWVAHQQHIKKGFQSDRCTLGFTYRVPTLVNGLSVVENRADVKVNDIWANDKKDHCGLVAKIEGEGEQQKITIRHCSSRQGGVFSNDFDTYFGGKGKFYRR